MPFSARTDVRLPVSLCESGILPQSIRRIPAAGQRQAAPCGAPHTCKRNRRLRMLRIKTGFSADAAPFPAAARHAATYVPPPAALSGGCAGYPASISPKAFSRHRALPFHRCSRRQSARPFSLCNTGHRLGPAPGIRHFPPPPQSCPRPRRASPGIHQKSPADGAFPAYDRSVSVMTSSEVSRKSSEIHHNAARPTTV